MSQKKVRNLSGFGQLVLGPPGSGKTTYCAGMCQLLAALPSGEREVAVVNLDPANEGSKYEAAVDIRELVDAAEVMEQLSLGPNGAMLFCMEYLEKNFSWLEEALAPLLAEQTYLIFDLPGQVELYTSHDSLKNIVAKLQKADLRLCAVHLVDAHHCSNAANFISAALLSLTAMLQLELPHVNVLSKIDLIESMGELDFNLEYVIRRPLL